MGCPSASLPVGDRAPAPHNLRYRQKVSQCSLSTNIILYPRKRSLNIQKVYIKKQSQIWLTWRNVFTHVIKKICKKWLVNNYTIKSYINLIGFLVIFQNRDSKSCKKKYYEANNLNKNYIKEISKKYNICLRIIDILKQK